MAAMVASAQSPWKIVELKLPEGAFYARPSSVDHLRNVYGQVQMSVGAYRPVRWLASTGWTPEFVGGQDGYARGTNGKGSFTGLVLMDGPVGGPSARPMLWGPSGSGQFLEGLPDYYRAEGIGVNASNAVAGSMIAKDFGHRAFYWKAGKTTEMPAFVDYPYAYSAAINNGGFIVGHAYDNYNPPTKSIGWIWTPTGGMQTLPGGGSYFRATGVNNTGLVCGTARISVKSVAMAWPAFGLRQMLEAFPSYPHAEAVSVGDNGDIAGNVWSGKWNQRTALRPVSWIGGVCRDISAESVLVDTTLGTANGINAKGDVVGDALFSGRKSGFLAIKR